MAKPEFERIYDPNQGDVHAAADGLSGNVTLCGTTDWIGEEQGRPTEDPINCDLCLTIIRYCQSHRL